MASALHNLSDYDPTSVPSTDGMRFGIVVSEWNSDVTGRLLEGAYETLQRHGVSEDLIIVKTVPGSFELIFGSAQMVKSGLVDAVIAIGCVIRGDTPHFDYICQGATQGLADLNLHGDVPVITTWWGAWKSQQGRLSRWLISGSISAVRLTSAMRAMSAPAFLLGSFSGGCRFLVVGRRR